MYSLTYVSSATGLLDEAALGEMLREIRPKNEALGLTGLLLYSNGNIIQVLEGPQDAVELTFRTIEADPRHRGVLVLLREQIESRAFSDWSMGFHAVSAEDLASVPGYNGFIRQPATAHYGDKTSSAHRLLRMFRENMR